MKVLAVTVLVVVAIQIFSCGAAAAPANKCPKGFNDCISRCVKGLGSNKDSNKLLGCSTTCVEACGDDESDGGDANAPSQPIEDMPAADKPKNKKAKKTAGAPEPLEEAPTTVEVGVSGETGAAKKKKKTKVLDLGGEGGKKVVPGMGEAPKKTEGVSASGKWKSLGEVSDGYADAVLASHWLDKIPHANLQESLKDVRRVLKPGGTAAFVVTDLEPLMRKQWDNYDAASFELVLKALYADTTQNMFWWSKLQAELQAAGFSGVEQVGGAPWTEQWDLDDEEEVDVVPLVVVARG